MSIFPPELISVFRFRSNWLFCFCLVLRVLLAICGWNKMSLLVNEVSKMHILSTFLQLTVFITGCVYFLSLSLSLNYRGYRKLKTAINKSHKWQNLLLYRPLSCIGKSTTRIDCQMHGEFFVVVVWETFIIQNHPSSC